MGFYYRHFGFFSSLLMSLWFATGCVTHANIEARPGFYRVEGNTTDPREFLETASRARVNEMNAATYQQAVLSGCATPYQGGGYGNDYEFYGFGSVYPAGCVPTGTVTQGLATKQELGQVREIAEDSMRQHGETRRYLEKKLGKKR